MRTLIPLQVDDLLRSQNGTGYIKADSLNFSLYIVVLFNYLLVMPVAAFTPVHNDA